MAGTRPESKTFSTIFAQSITLINIRTDDVRLAIIDLEDTKALRQLKPLPADWATFKRILLFAVIDHRPRQRILNAWRCYSEQEEGLLLQISSLLLWCLNAHTFIVNFYVSTVALAGEDSISAVISSDAVKRTAQGISILAFNTIAIIGINLAVWGAWIYAL